MAQVIRPLNTADIAYMVTGSVAGSLYGEPRMTNDIDVVISLDARHAARFCALFQIEKVYCPPEEVLEIETGRERRGHFNLIVQSTGFKVDCYLAGRDPLHLWALPQRRWVEVGGERVCLAPPEYVIIRKLEYFKEGGSSKHMRDIAAMINTLGPRLDSSSMVEWIERLHLQDEWGLAQKDAQRAEGGIP